MKLVKPINFSTSYKETKKLSDDDLRQLSILYNLIDGLGYPNLSNNLKKEIEHYLDITKQFKDFNSWVNNSNVKKFINNLLDRMA